MSLSESQRAAYRYLRARADDGAADLERVAGWKPATFSTFRTKHLRDYLVSAGRGHYRIEPQFLRLTPEQFGDIVGQSRKAVARFQRTVVHAVLRYEFLLPLTNERKLREALDELFYREPLEQRAREIGRENLSRIMPPKQGESDKAYFSRVSEQVGSLLGGYSIGHVDGRFRAGSLLTYVEAAQVLAAKGRYLVDETTAVVRFILPIPESKESHGDTFIIDMATPPAPVDSAHLTRAKQLFIAFFVESVILGIHGEDEIWFLESDGHGERLYVLEKRAEATSTVAPTRHGKNEKTQSLFPEEPSDSLDAWLRHSYPHVADMIDRITSGWRAEGLRTRRNWFDILAGDSSGRERGVAGETFPIIASIRARKGLPPVAGALWKPGEAPLPRRHD
jgi:hypothetical protein